MARSKGKRTQKQEKANKDVEELNTQITHLKEQLKSTYFQRRGLPMYDVQGNLAGRYCASCGQVFLSGGVACLVCAD